MAGRQLPAQIGKFESRCTHFSANVKYTVGIRKSKQKNNAWNQIEFPVQSNWFERTVPLWSYSQHCFFFFLHPTRRFHSTFLTIFVPRSGSDGTDKLEIIDTSNETDIVETLLFISIHGFVNVFVLFLRWNKFLCYIFQRNIITISLKWF